MKVVHRTDALPAASFRAFCNSPKAFGSIATVHQPFGAAESVNENRLATYYLVDTSFRRYLCWQMPPSQPRASPHIRRRKPTIRGTARALYSRAATEGKQG